MSPVAISRGLFYPKRNLTRPVVKESLLRCSVVTIRRNELLKRWPNYG
jgi:hypothetical protein